MEKLKQGHGIGKMNASAKKGLRWGNAFLKKGTVKCKRL